MNRIGINLWNYTKGYTDKDLALIDRVAALSFTAVEIPMLYTDFSAAKLAAEIGKYDLEVTQCAALNSGRDLSHEDAAVRESTKDYLKKCVDIGFEIGSKLICGPLYAGGGKAHYLKAEDRAAELMLAAEGIAQIADYAAQAGMQLAIEPINRYRTSVVNTAGQALALVKMIDKANVGVLYDTYQANIEEVNVVTALKEVLQNGLLFHLHACENNRGVPGMGHVPFAEIFVLLKKYGYERHLTLETFMPESLDAVWSPMAPSQDELALTGLNNLKNLLSEAETVM